MSPERDGPVMKLIERGSAPCSSRSRAKPSSYARRIRSVGSTISEVSGRKASVVGVCGARQVAVAVDPAHRRLHRLGLVGEQTDLAVVIEIGARRDQIGVRLAQ